MNRIFLTICLLVTMFGLQAEETIRVLGIGNSFTNNAYKYLGPISDASPKHKLILGSATIGGCSLERHHKHMKEFKADPNTGNAYKFYLRDPKTGVEKKEPKKTLHYALIAERWDYISIQQVSRLSTLPETYEPFAGELIAFIKKYAPQAKIMIHQTWAYRVDGDFDKVWPDKKGYDQAAMYKDSASAYEALGKKYNLDLLRSGAAFQLARERRPFVPQEHDLTQYKKWALPPQPHSLCTGYRWGRNNKIGNDSHHAGPQGCLLAGLVWYETITQQDATKLDLSKIEIPEADKKFLQQVAHDLVSGGQRPSIQPK